MAALTIEVPDEIYDRVVAAFSQDYQEDGPTRGQLTKQAVLEYIKSIVVGYEANIAEQEAVLALKEAQAAVSQARQEATEQANNEIVLS